MKKLFCDDFQVASGSRADSLIDVITESVAENGYTRKFQVVTLTALIHGVLDHLVSTDLLVSSSLPPNAPPQSLAQVGVNISYMAHRAVDCLWNGLIVGEPLKLLQLLYSVYSIASRKENKVRRRLPSFADVRRSETLSREPSCRKLGFVGKHGTVTTSGERMSALINSESDTAALLITRAYTTTMSRAR
ncbi:unnamed protein product [Heligmosomoides polygyrus]|uniref:Reverse transcriptase domain-containing protein n=1 Tax=Heligmosomoides polygyrus TaxID=6339 RepID=A0A3P8AL15_HELPZ|nr:unnamed protein product [Heligmosomoides polygyrus]